jgi:hypothetical protein
VGRLEWNPNVSGAPAALVVYEAVAYAAETFPRFRGTPRFSLAAIDPASGALVR